MNYERVVAAAMESVSASTADDPMIELVTPTFVFAEILRINIGPAEQATLPEPTPYAFYTATAAGAGGVGLTEVIQRGTGTIGAFAERNLTAPGVAGFREFPQGTVPWEIGLMYVPEADDRFQVRTGGQLVFGVLFTSAPSVAVTFTLQIVWGEVG